MAKKKTTIHDLARELNITAATVSRALNNHPKISSKTKARVKEAANEFGYQRNVVASNFRTGKTKTIGLIVPRINRQFFADTISGIESITSPAGYNLIICQSDEKLEKEIHNINTLMHSRVQGVIISVSQETLDGKHFYALKNAGISIVQFDRTIEGIDTVQVVNDNFNAAYQATQHLIKQGYTKIGHFAGNLNNNIYRQRLDGYKQALLDNNIELNYKWIFNNTVSKDSGIEVARRILESKEKPDSIFSSGDYSIMGALSVFKAAGLCFPKQMGAVGFSNEPFTEFTTPSISSVNQFGVEMGVIAARNLIEQIESVSKQNISNIITIQSKLLIRDSSQRIHL